MRRRQCGGREHVSAQASARASRRLATPPHPTRCRPDPHRPSPRRTTQPTTLPSPFPQVHVLRLRLCRPRLHLGGHPRVRGAPPPPRLRCVRRAADSGHGPAVGMAQCEISPPPHMDVTAARINGTLQFHGDLIHVRSVSPDWWMSALAPCPAPTLSRRCRFRLDHRLERAVPLSHCGGGGGVASLEKILPSSEGVGAMGVGVWRPLLWSAIRPGAQTQSAPRYRRWASGS